MVSKKTPTAKERARNLCAFCSDGNEPRNDMHHGVERGEDGFGVALHAHSKIERHHVISAIRHALRVLVKGGE